VTIEYRAVAKAIERNAVLGPRGGDDLTVVGVRAAIGGAIAVLAFG